MTWKNASPSAKARTFFVLRSRVLLHASFGSPACAPKTFMAAGTCARCCCCTMLTRRSIRGYKAHYVRKMEKKENSFRRKFQRGKSPSAVLKLSKQLLLRKRTKKRRRNGEMTRTGAIKKIGPYKLFYFSQFPEIKEGV